MTKGQKDKRTKGQQDKKNKIYNKKQRPTNESNIVMSGQFYLFLNIQIVWREVRNYFMNMDSVM